MKKLMKLLEKRGLTITENHSYHFGRYTLVELTSSKGHSAIGISRCSDLDTLDPLLGESIARGRAEHAMNSLLKKKKIQSCFMG